MRRQKPGVASIPILFYLVDYSAGGVQGRALPPLFYPAPRYSIWSQLGQSIASPGSCPLRRGPLELGLMSVAKLQVSLVRLVRSMMLESLPACLFMDFCEPNKPDSNSPSQIATPLRKVFFA